MAQQWYYRSADALIGPLAPTELQAHVVDGRLTRAMHVRLGEGGNWISAGAVRGLFSEAPTPGAHEDDGEIYGLKEPPPEPVGVPEQPADRDHDAPVARDRNAAPSPPFRLGPVLLMPALGLGVGGAVALVFYIVGSLIPAGAGRFIVFPLCVLTGIALLHLSLRAVLEDLVVRAENTGSEQDERDAHGIHLLKVFFYLRRRDTKRQSRTALLFSVLLAETVVLLLMSLMIVGPTMIGKPITGGYLAILALLTLVFCSLGALAGWLGHALGAMKK